MTSPYLERPLRTEAQVLAQRMRARLAVDERGIARSNLDEFAPLHREGLAKNRDRAFAEARSERDISDARGLALERVKTELAADVRDWLNALDDASTPAAFQSCARELRDIAAQIDALGEAVRTI